MTPSLDLTEDQREVFQELINVAYGTATSAIANIINSHASLAVPEIQVVPTEEVFNYLSNKLESQHAHFLCKQQFHGNFAGESLVIMGEPSAKNLSHEFDIPADELNQDVMCDMILELTNILSSATIGILSEQTNSSVTFSAPEIEIIDRIDNISQHQMNLFSKIVIISTILSFEKNEILAEYMLLTTDQSFNYLKQSLQTIVDELL